MKRLLPIVLMSLCLSCAKNDVVELCYGDHILKKEGSPLTKSSINKGEPYGQSCDVSLATAKLAAESVFSSGQKLVDFYPFVYAEDTLFYVANYSKGYKIISADSRTSAILMESDEGGLHLNVKKFADESEKMNAPLFWLDILSEDIYALKKDNAQPDGESNIEFWNSMSQSIMPLLDSIDFEDPYHTWVKIQEYETYNTYDEGNVNHLIQTKWGQGYPWNTMVPADATGANANCPTGCTAVALAQLLYFTHYNLGKPLWLYHDAQITGYSYNSNNYSFQYSPGTYTSNSTRWDDMAWYGFETPPYTDYVSSLMADVGHVIGILYTPERGSGNYSIDHFNYYGLDCSYSTYDKNLVSADLNNGMPVIVTAFAGERRFLGIHVSYYDGHAWLIDGKKTQVNETIRGYVWKRVSDLDTIPTDLQLYSEEQARALESDLYSGKRVTETLRSYSYFFRMNWGGDGEDDDVLYGASWTTQWSGIGYDFQYDKHIYYNIH